MSPVAASRHAGDPSQLDNGWQAAGVTIVVDDRRWCDHGAVIDAVEVELILRLVLAAVVGGIVGAEREVHGHPAGMRTHLLVALGSGVFTVLSVHGFGSPGAGVDPTRIAA